ncbi:MAG: hypothetical protein RSB99_02030 [Bacilli bacterium]
MGTKKILYYCILTFLIIIAPIHIVEADERTTTADGQVCVGGKIYQINNQGNKVKGNLGKIDLDAIEQKCLLVKGKCLGADYKFKATSLGVSCVIDGATTDAGYKFLTCPTDADVGTVPKMTDVQEMLSLTYVNNKWAVKIDGLKGYKVKKVPKQDGVFKQVCTNYDTSASGEKRCTNWDYKGTFITPNASGVYDYVTPGDSYFYAFYLNTGSACQDAYMGYIQGAGSSYVVNPEYASATCTNYRNQHPSGIEKALVPECYQDKITFSKIPGLANVINLKIDRASSILNKLSSGTVDKKLQCDFNSANNKDVNIGDEYTKLLEVPGSGKYWQALCTEKLVVSYDTPKGIRAGMGFTYGAHVSIQRTCIPIEISKPEKKDTCTYGVECWGGPANHTGEAGAGPSKDFDSCVNTCDGGKYTQKCINKCYEANYKDNVIKLPSPLYRQFSLYDDKYNVMPMAFQDIGSKEECNQILGKPYGSTRNPISSCLVTVDNFGCPEWDICLTEHNIRFTYKPWCNSSDNPTKCYEVFTSNPDCEANAEELYKNAISASLAELTAVNEAISKFTSESMGNDSFNATITDSHTGKVQEYKKGTNAELQVTPKKDPSTGLNYTTSAISNPENIIIAPGVSRQVKTYTVTQDLDIKLDKAYLSKQTSSDIIYGEQYYNKHTNIQPYYYDGGNKYYTNLSATGFNLYENWPTIIGYDNPSVVTSNSPSINQNIKLNFSKLGTWDQWNSVDIDCFYGIKKNSGPIVPEVPDCKPGDICSKGLTFMYRPIDLNKPFLDREPRWNWSVNATNNKFNINPIKTLEDIKTKGNSIYKTSNTSYDINAGTSPEVSNNELDYEIILTKQHINSIRQYNKSKKGKYLDYDMYCYNSGGANICKSSFLGSNEFSSNGTHMLIAKRGLIGCNDQSSATECLVPYKNIGSR